VFFRKEPSKYEVINDIDSDLVSFYRVLQNHLEEFMKQFKWLLSSREWFEDWKRQQEAGGLTDIQRAARYYYLQRQSFGGKVRGRSFGANVEHQPKINLLRMEEELSEVHLRLSRVSIENLDWSVFIQRYDRAETFFYLDPPYFKVPVYKHNLGPVSDYEKIADVLRGISGKFILSINDTKEMRTVFQPFAQKYVNVNYTAAGGKHPKVGKELLVSNCF
jgi:DNA adenine methylase